VGQLRADPVVGQGRQQADYAVWDAHRGHRKVGVFGHLAARQFVDAAKGADEVTGDDETAKDLGMDPLFYRISQPNRAASAGKREGPRGHGFGRRHV
jgi:hypothetical protein